MPSQSSDPDNIPARMNGADLAAFVGKAERTTTALLSSAGISGDKRKGYDVRKCVPILCAAQDEAAKRLEAQAAADRARKNTAEASGAEMDTAKKAKALCFRDDYLANYADAIAQGVRNISRLEELNTTQKEAVMAALRSVRLRELEGAD